MCSKLKTKEAEMICNNCEKKQLEEYPKAIMCAFRNDNAYCDRIEDIDALIEKLQSKE